ncbi:uncharacterized protein [Elaeis guineensis]|uniref:uncharacterized protein n=1 Tax=Elaeis guineensis var. tenera TaxID=51953 RepID=UPI003C6D52FC
MFDQRQLEEPKASEPGAVPNSLAEPSLEFVVPTSKVVVSLPNRLRSNRNSAQLDKILEVFKQVKVNIPLLDMIQLVPTYAKFCKDLYTKKKTTNVPKKAFLAASVNSYLSSHVLVKYKDPGSPTISCITGKTIIDRILLDFGTSVNILPYSVYAR